MKLKIVAITAGSHNTVAVSTDGSVWSWGSNSTDHLLGVPDAGPGASRPDVGASGAAASASLE